MKTLGPLVLEHISLENIHLVLDDEPMEDTYAKAVAIASNQYYNVTEEGILGALRGESLYYHLVRFHPKEADTILEIFKAIAAAMGKAPERAMPDRLQNGRGRGTEDNFRFAQNLILDGYTNPEVSTDDFLLRLHNGGLYLILCHKPWPKIEAEVGRPANIVLARQILATKTGDRKIAKLLLYWQLAMVALFGTSLSSARLIGVQWPQFFTDIRTSVALLQRDLNVIAVAATYLGQLRKQLARADLLRARAKVLPHRK